MLVLLGLSCGKCREACGSLNRSSKKMAFLAAKLHSVPCSTRVHGKKRGEGDFKLKLSQGA